MTPERRCMDVGNGKKHRSNVVRRSKLFTDWFGFLVEMKTSTIIGLDYISCDALCVFTKLFWEREMIFRW